VSGNRCTEEEEEEEERKVEEDFFRGRRHPLHSTEDSIVDL